MFIEFGQGLYQATM